MQKKELKESGELFFAFDARSALFCTNNRNIQEITERAMQKSKCCRVQKQIVFILHGIRSIKYQYRQNSR